MKKTIVSLILFIIFGLISNNNAISWDNDITHMQLSEYAAKSSVLDKNKGDYLRSLGFGDALDTRVKWGIEEKTITKWIQKGAQLEDSGTNLEMVCGTARSYNHFHNPLKPWSNAGLDDYVVNLCPPVILIPPLRRATGESSLLWAQDGTLQQNFTERDWSWQKVRGLLYSALTSSTDSERQTNFAQAFRGLGHQLHLLQDAGQPDHVRNDAHPVDGAGVAMGLETWTKNNPDFIMCLLTQHNTLPPDTLSKCQQYNINESINIDNYYPTISTDPLAYSLDPSYYSKNMTPVALFIDTDQYNGAAPSTSISQGLAEYTNANFVSDDTIFTEALPNDDRHYFPFPRKTSTNIQELQNQTLLPVTIISQDGVAEKSFYIKKNADGEMIEHFVKPRYLTNNVYSVAGGGGYIYNRTFYRDETCHQDYAQKLLPRAVGYSAGLLNYFFRGNIDIALPNSGIFSSTTNTALGFTTIKVQAKNTTTNNEDMLNGSIEIVVKYKRALEDPFKNYPEEYDFQVEPEFTYIVASEKNGIRGISGDHFVELAFDLPTPIPLWAIDVYLQVVYHGKLGNEDGAVAVGFKDISEPTPIDDFNNMDKICISGVWYAAGSPEAYNALPASAKYWDYWAHDLKDDYIKISPSGSPVDASASAFTFYKPLVEAGTLYRTFILSDYDFAYSGYGVMAAKDTRDHNDHSAAIKKTTAQGTGVRNQEETINDQDICESYGLTTPCTIRFQPLFYTFRGVDLWGAGGFITDGVSYPNVTDPSYIPCSWSDVPL